MRWWNKLVWGVLRWLMEGDPDLPRTNELLRALEKQVDEEKKRGTS